MMKKISFTFFFICIFACFSCSKIYEDIFEDSQENPEIEQEIEIPNVAKAFVNLEQGKLHVLKCDTAAGRYSVGFEQTPPNIKTGNVIILSTDSTNFVILVTKAQSVGKQVDMEGELGDLSYVFSDTEFVFETSNEQTRGSRGNVFYPIDTQITRSTWNLWSTSKEYSTDLFNKNNLHIWIESKYKASVDASISFKFGKPVETKIQGISFLKAKDFDIDFSIKGDVEAAQDIFMKLSGKGEIDLSPEHKDKYALLKHNLLPQREFLFPVGQYRFRLHLAVTYLLMLV